MTTTAKKHIGRNIAKIREIKGIKQEALADLMGVSQQKISQYENTEEIDDAKLEPFAKALGVTSEAIKNFSDENVINYFANFYDNSANNGSIHAHNCTFNPLDKVVELYERLVQAEKDKVAYLEQLMGKK